MVATPGPDGTVRVEQELIFDAGPGMDYPVTWYIGGTQIGWKSSSPAEAQYGVIPTIVTNLEAREIGGLDLTVRDTERIDRTRSSTGTATGWPPPVPWAPGRHAVMISYTLGEVWVQADGVRCWCCRCSSAAARPTPSRPTWSGCRCAGATRLQCPATNVNFADRRCVRSGRPAAPTTTVSWTSVEAVVVPDPAGVTAEPIPVTEERP